MDEAKIPDLELKAQKYDFLQELLKRKIGVGDVLNCTDPYKDQQLKILIAQYDTSGDEHLIPFMAVDLSDGGVIHYATSINELKLLLSNDARQLESVGHCDSDGIVDINPEMERNYVEKIRGTQWNEKFNEASFTDLWKSARLNTGSIVFMNTMQENDKGVFLKTSMYMVCGYWNNDELKNCYLVDLHSGYAGKQADSIDSLAKTCLPYKPIMLWKRN
uniref:hypothetical protein n=1 Tax=Lactobacillus acidophilus TaxID=1579 RepID=UPI003F57AE59